MFCTVVVVMDVQLLEDFAQLLARRSAGCCLIHSAGCCLEGPAGAQPCRDICSAECGGTLASRLRFLMSQCRVAELVGCIVQRRRRE